MNDHNAMESGPGMAPGVQERGAKRSEEELALLEMQQRLEEQQARYEEAFSNVVALTRDLQASEQARTDLQNRLQAQTDELRGCQARIGELVSRLEANERALDDRARWEAQCEQLTERALAAEQRAAEAASREAVSAAREQALDRLVQRQSEDMGKLVRMLEDAAQREKAAAQRAAGGGLTAGLASLGAPLKAAFRRVFNRGERARLARQVAMIEASPLFDASWYLTTYPDVAADQHFARSPARHYLLRGGFEGRQPGPEFDSAFYIASYDDVRESGINPLLHYLKFGQQENRRIKADA